MGIGQVLYNRVLASCLLVLTVNCGADKGTGPNGVQSRIAFSSNRDGNDEIYVMDPDGTNPIRLTNDWAADQYPVWSPDGSGIAFVSSRDRQGKSLYVMNADGTKPIPLAVLRGSGYVRRPAWSPDGTSIIFPSQPPDITDPRQDGNAALYVMNADGTNLTRLTNPAYEYWPAWSPDGTNIAFTSERAGSPSGIYVMNADGTNSIRLTSKGESQPAWSPDGTKIACIGSGSSDSDGPDIYVVNADGTSPIRLTTDPADDSWPTWSPDGTQIAFTSSRNRIPEVYVMNADGTKQTQLTWNPSYGIVSDAHDLSPAWSPFLRR